MSLPRALIFASEKAMPYLAAWLKKYEVRLQAPHFFYWESLASVLQGTKMTTDSSNEQNLTENAEVEHSPLSNSQEIVRVLKSPTFNFKVATYHKYLKTHSFGQQFCYQPIVDSTQSLLLKALDSAGRDPSNQKCEIDACAFQLDGLAITADRQLKGQGRGSNVWESPTGSLSVSFVVKYSNGSTLPFVQYLVSLAAVKAIRSKPGLEDLPVHIKWPNDIYVNKNIKIGGVLCNSQYDGKWFSVVVGIGVNVNNSKPTTCLNDVIREHTLVCKDENSQDFQEKAESMAAEDLTLSREELLARFFNTFEDLQRDFLEKGFTPFRDDYIALWLHSGQEVFVERRQIVKKHDDKTHSNEKAQVFDSGDKSIDAQMENVHDRVQRARIVGIAASGNLTVQFVSDEGEAVGMVEEVIPDTSSLDMLHGLVTQKASSI